MFRLAVRCAALLSLAGLAVSAPTAAQSTIRSGSEFQINTYTPGYQSVPAVALDGDGDFIVAWSSSDQDGSNYGIFARRFAASGSPLAAEFQVNTYTMNYQAYPAVARRAGGDFVVVWSSFGQDGSGYGVFARRFSASGGPLATELQVNVHTNDNQAEAAVAMNGAGDFVVAWQSDGQDGYAAGVFARRFDAAGVAQAAEFQVNTQTADGQYHPAVAMDGAGGFVIAWQTSEQDGDNNAVFARRFDAAGIAQAVEFQVNTYTLDGQSSPALAMNAAGQFVVSWESDGQDGSGQGIFARRFNAAGVAQSVEMQVATYTVGEQRISDAAIDGDGGFVVVWRSEYQDGSEHGVFSRRFDAAGSPQAVELQVNTYTPGAQQSAAVAMDAGGDFVVAWRSRAQDGDDDGVFAQRFVTLAVLDIDGDGETAALTDGLLVLRFLFGFTGGTLVSGAVDVGSCTRCNAAAIEAYLQTLI